MSRPRPADLESLTPFEVAKLLKLTPGALKKMRLRGKGPRYFRASEQCIRYRESDVSAWIDSRIEDIYGGGPRIPSIADHRAKRNTETT